MSELIRVDFIWANDSARSIMAEALLRATRMSTCDVPT